MGYIVPDWLAPVVAAFIIREIWLWYQGKRQKFYKEYRIKGELETIKHDLDVQGKLEEIDSIYEANWVRDEQLFGDNNIQVIYWFKRFENYNRRLRLLKGSNKYEYATVDLDRERMIREIEIMLNSHFLKRIPSEPSNLSKQAFVRYLLGWDAREEN